MINSGYFRLNPIPTEIFLYPLPTEGANLATPSKIFKSITFDMKRCWVIVFIIEGQKMKIK